MKKVLFTIMILVQVATAGSPSQILKSAAKIMGGSAENYSSKLLKISKGFGDDAAKYIAKVQSKYGSKGIAMLEKYGDRSVLSSSKSLELVSRYGDDGYYLLKRIPEAPQLYGRFGESYVKTADRFGAQRVSRWLTQADAKGKGKEVLGYLEKLGAKAAHFYEKNWGKLLVTGFVGLNASTILAYGKDVSMHTIDRGADTVVKGVETVANTIIDSPLLYTLIFSIIAYTLLSLWIKWKKYADFRKAAQNDNICH